MTLEYVDLDVGRVYFIRGVHPVTIWISRKRAAIRTYLKVKSDLEEGLRLSGALATELIIPTYRIKDYNPDKYVQYCLNGIFLPEFFLDYYVLKCIKENRDVYFCDVLQAESKIRALASAILPAAILTEVVAIASLSGQAAPRLFIDFFIAIFAGGMGYGFLNPSRIPAKIARRLKSVIMPVLGTIDKFREITTAIQLRTILERGVKNNAITYISHGYHTDSVKKYVQMPKAKLKEELDKLVQIEQVYKTHFRDPIKIPITEWDDQKRAELLEKSREKGFDVEAI